MATRSFVRRPLRLGNSSSAPIAMVLAILTALLPALPLEASSAVPPDAAAPAASVAAAAAPAADLGTIAYFDRFGADLRVVGADGSNNHVLWANPNPNYLPINVDWRHDGLELAFSSPHEQTCSVFDSDIYAIHADGTGFRRVTNAPTCAELAPLPKGSVLLRMTTGVTTFVYVPGAAGVVGPVTGMVTIDNIADFGPGRLQQPVAIMGQYRQLFGPPVPDILPNQTVEGGVVITGGDTGYPYGAGAPSWRADGSSIAYHQRANTFFFNIAANPDYGREGDKLPTAAGVSAALIDWNPTLAENDQYLYYSSDVNTDAAHGIWLHDLNDPAQCRRLFHQGPWEGGIYDVEWLPDGSGFLFVMQYTGWLDPRGYTCPDSYGSCRNVFRYDLETGAVTQLTDFTDWLTNLISVSSDGQSIIFERWDDPDFDTGGDLWLMNADGSNQRLFIEDAARPAWFGPGGNVPAMAPFVTVERDEMAIYLNWDDFAINVGGYKVSYSEDPYFQVGDDGVMTADVGAGYEGWNDLYEEGEPNPNHNSYYFVQGVGAGGALSGPSNRTGGFTFALTAGS